MLAAKEFALSSLRFTFFHVRVMSVSMRSDRELASSIVSVSGLRLFHVVLCGVMCSSFSRKSAVVAMVVARAESVTLKLVLSCVYSALLCDWGGCV